jgi:hypothetical protein
MLGIDKAMYNLSFIASYTDFNQLLAPVTTFDQSTGIASTTYDNSLSAKQFGFETNFGLNWKKIFFSTFMYLRYKYFIASEKTANTNSGVIIGGNVNLSYRVSRTLNLRYSSQITPVNISPQGRTSSYHYYRIEASKSIFKRKVTITAFVTRLFNKYWRERSVLQEKINLFESEVVNFNPFRLLGVGFAYNFGRLRENLSRKKGVRVDDIK